MPMSTIENTGQMVSFMCFPDRTYQVFDILTFMSTLDVPETLPLPPALLIPPRLLNQYYLDASIGGKNSFYNRGAFGVGQSTNWFLPGFFQVWIFGGGCFMFKHPHEETIEQIEHFEAVLNFSVVISFLATALFLKKHRWTSQICQRSADFILRWDWYVGPFAIKHRNSWSCRISTFWLKNVDKHIPNQTCRVIHHPLSYPTSSASIPRIIFSINTPNSESLP